MKLKQPEVPGIWGSWDPSDGPQRDAGRGDWPDYKAAVTQDDPPPTQDTMGDKSMQATSDPQNIWELQSRLIQSPSSAFDPESAPRSLPPPANIASGQDASSLRYKSPEPAAKQINPDTDFRKDAELKRITADTQRDISNGPMWGVAAAPPIDFRGWDSASAPAVDSDELVRESNNASRDSGRRHSQDQAEDDRHVPGMWKYGAVWSDDKVRPPRGDQRDKLWK